MFLAEPTPTAWDLHFRVLGIPVRISPWFWVGTAILGWSFAQGIGNARGSNLSVGVALVIWIGAVLVSILFHEFGHALAFRYYGIRADVVLYQFGGLAAPRGSLEFGRQIRLSPQQHIVISAAGPAASLLLGFLVAAVFHLAGYSVPNPIRFLPLLDFLMDGNPLPSIALFALVYAMLFVNIWWALMNLLPVYPLDGGQISREVFTLSSPRDGIRHSLMLSIIAGGAVAVWALSKQDTYLAIMFGMLAYSSYMTLQAYMGRGGGFGGNM